ncbi:MAG TPA: thiamine-phosphate kinase [Armatimonadota bacterium]|nr:thiamine-phosphate kinase [Armatimonadota bacterium]
MKLSEIGEEALIERIIRENLLPKSGPGLVVGVGDDAAVLDLGSASGALTIVTTDILIEGTHFRLGLTTPYELGWKSVAANISDIAAMGGVPTWTFVALGLRPDTQVGFVDALYRGMTECAGRFGSTLVGGDTSSAEANSVISVCQIGQVEPGLVALRSGARIGDRVLVTGWLGNSRGGLELLLKFGLEEAARLAGWLVSIHLMPVPRIAEGRAAVHTGAVHAMMDISDGLGADLPKLCRASGVGAVVWADKLPVGADLRTAADSLGADATDLAASGGEDFELLMVVGPEDVGRVVQAVEDGTGTRVTEIGEIAEGPVEIVYPDGARKPLKGGWEHFVGAE